MFRLETGLCVERKRKKILENNRTKNTWDIPSRYASQTARIILILYSKPSCFCVYSVFFLVQTNINSVTIFNKFNLFYWFEKIASNKTKKKKYWKCVRELEHYLGVLKLYEYSKNHGGWWIESTFHKNQKLFKQKYIGFCLLFNQRSLWCMKRAFSSCFGCYNGKGLSGK